MKNTYPTSRKNIFSLYWNQIFKCPRIKVHDWTLMQTYCNSRDIFIASGVGESSGVRIELTKKNRSFYCVLDFSDNLVSYLCMKDSFFYIILIKQIISQHLRNWLLLKEYELGKNVW